MTGHLEDQARSHLSGAGMVGDARKRLAEQQDVAPEKVRVALSPRSRRDLENYLHAMEEARDRGDEGYSRSFCAGFRHALEMVDAYVQLDRARGETPAGPLDPDAVAEAIATAAAIERAHERRRVIVELNQATFPGHIAATDFLLGGICSVPMCTEPLLQDHLVCAAHLEWEDPT